MLMLVNLDPGKSYLGVYLGSGPCVAAMRTLIETDYDKFEQLFQRELQHRMKGGDPVERLERAWRIYSQWRLAGLGLGGEWERAYLEMDEFDILFGSYNMFHFGARFPLFFGDDALRPVPVDWYSLRLHLYSGNTWVPAGQSNVCRNGHTQDVQDGTTDLSDPIPYYNMQSEKTSAGKPKKGAGKWIPALHPRWNGMKGLNQFRPKFM